MPVETCFNGHYFVLINSKNGRLVSRVLSPDFHQSLYHLSSHDITAVILQPTPPDIFVRKEIKRAALLYRNSGKQSGCIWLCNP